MSSGPCVLIISPDPETRSSIGDLFQSEGFETLETKECPPDGQPFAFGDVDLVVCDARLSTGQAFALCRKLAVEGGAPVILLSDRADAVSRIVALEVGADDLLGLPLDHRLMLAQARALMRRSRAHVSAASAARSDAGWVVDPVSRAAIGPDGARLPLSPQEVLLMDMFLGNPGVVFTPKTAMEWNPTLKQDSSVGFRTAMSRLRRKLASSELGAAIQTVHGAGYIYAGAGNRDADSAVGAP